MKLPRSAIDMKEHLKKADVLGLAIIAAALITYSIRSIWTPYQTAAVVAGGRLAVASWTAKFEETRASLGRRSTRFGINSATSVFLLLGVLAMVNYLGAQHQKRFDLTTEKLNSLSEQSASVADQVT